MKPTHLPRAVIAAGIATCAASFSFAQTNAPSTDQDETVVLSMFEVQSSAGSGYRVSNAMSATKSRKALVDIPANVTVATRDFIEDMHVEQSIGDVLKYITSGAPPATNRNDFVLLRGQRFEAPFQDGRRVMNVVADMSAIDSIEIIKGSNAVLYGTRAPAGGLVNRVSKKPEMESKQTVTVRYGSWNAARAEIDSTGAVPGSDKFAYRLIGAWQEDDGFWQYFDQTSVAPMLQFNTDDTTIRYQLLWSEAKTGGELPNGIANPDGTPFIGGGRSQEYRAPWSFLNKETANHLFTWIQKWGTWETKATAGREIYHRDEEDHRRQGAPNFATGLSPHRYFGQTQKRLFDALQFDVVGTYHLGSVPITTNLGVSWERETFLNDRQEIDLASGQRLGAYSRVTTATAAQGLMDIRNPNLAAIQLPGVADRIRFGQYNETDNRITSSTFYLVQSLDVIRDRLSITAGGSRAGEESIIKNLPDASQPAANFDTSEHDYLYSVGTTLRIVSGLNLYAQTATVFSPNQASATTPAGLRPPAVTGRSSEVGVKGSVLGGKISGTLSAYELNLKNFATFNSTLNAFVVNDTENRGFEVDLFLQPTDALQIIGTWFSADVSDSRGTPVNQSYEQAWSVWSKYTFEDGAVRGLSLGIGAFHRGALQFSTGPASGSYTTIDFSASYRRNNWSLNVFVKNVTDEIYNIGSTGATNIDISSPTSVTGTFVYRF